MYILLAISALCPLFIFFDYSKRSNIYIAIVYVAVFILSWAFILRPLIMELGLTLAFAIPFLMVIFLLLAKKRKGIKKKTNQSVIDDPE